MISTAGQEAAQPHEARPRVFLGLRETAGYYANLRLGLTELGVVTTHWDLAGDPLNLLEGGEASHRFARSIANRRNTTRGIARAWWRLVQTVLAGWIVVGAIPRHEVFIFGSPQVALLTFGYPALRLCRKTVITVFHGTDARPPYMNAKFAGTSGPVEVDRLNALTKRTKASVRMAERFSHVVVNHPPTAQFASREFVDFLSVGIPLAVEMDTVRDNTRQVESPPVRVLHAPSNVAAKGTAEIRRAINALIEEGVPIDYVEVTAVPHERVLIELSRADVVVDQAFSDQPMPSLATEAAAHGIPVAIGSNDWEGALWGIAAGNVPPTIRSSPTELQDVIRKLVVDREARRTSGAAAASFVHERWSRRAVARRVLRVVNGDIPDEWWRDPRDVRYIHGVGMDEDRLAKVVSLLISKHGPAALQLDDKPSLRDKLIALAQTH